jgi:hypothetical protein
MQRHREELDFAESTQKTSSGDSAKDADITLLQSGSYDHGSFELELDETDVAMAIQSIRNRAGLREPYMETGPFSSFADTFTPRNYTIQGSEFEEHIDNVDDTLDELSLHAKDPTSVEAKQVVWTGESYVQPCQELGRSINYSVVLPVQDIPSPMLPREKFSLAREVQILKDITIEVCGRVCHEDDDKQIFESKGSLVSTEDESKHAFSNLFNPDSDAAGVLSSQKSRHVGIGSTCDSNEEWLVQVPKENAMAVSVSESSAKETTNVASLQAGVEVNAEQMAPPARLVRPLWLKKSY